MTADDLTPFERETIGGFLAAIVDDDGFDTYGLSSREKAAIHRGLSKLLPSRRQDITSDRPQWMPVMSRVGRAAMATGQWRPAMCQRSDVERIAETMGVPVEAVPHLYDDLGSHTIGCHCSRCGVEYATPDRPGCECAGDLPTDYESPDYRAYLDRVRRLRFDRLPTDPTKGTS